MLGRGKMDRNVIEMVEIGRLVPKEHLFRKIDEAVNFNCLYKMVEPLYCEDNGRPSIGPVVLFKMVLIQHLYGLSAADSGGNKRQYLLPLVSGIHLAGGNTPFFHSEL